MRGGGAPSPVLCWDGTIDRSAFVRDSIPPYGLGRRPGPSRGAGRHGVGGMGSSGGNRSRVGHTGIRGRVGRQDFNRPTRRFGLPSPVLSSRRRLLSFARSNASSAPSTRNGAGVHPNLLALDRTFFLKWQLQSGASAAKATIQVERCRQMTSWLGGDSGKHDRSMVDSNSAVGRGLCRRNRTVQEKQRRRLRTSAGREIFDTHGASLGPGREAGVWGGSDVGRRQPTKGGAAAISKRTESSERRTARRPCWACVRLPRSEFFRMPCSYARLMNG